MRTDNKKMFTKMEIPYKSVQGNDYGDIFTLLIIEFKFFLFDLLKIQNSPKYRGVVTPWCPKYRGVETLQCPMYWGVVFCFLEPSSPCYSL